MPSSHKEGARFLEAFYQNPRPVLYTELPENPIYGAMVLRDERGNFSDSSIQLQLAEFYSTTLSIYPGLREFFLRALHTPDCYWNSEIRQSFVNTFNKPIDFYFDRYDLEFIERNHPDLGPYHHIEFKDKPTLFGSTRRLRVMNYVRIPVYPSEA